MNLLCNGRNLLPPSPEVPGEKEAPEEPCGSPQLPDRVEDLGSDPRE